MNARQMVSAAGNVDGQFSLTIDASNELQWFYQEGKLYAFYRVNHVRTTAATLTYDAVQHAWWRIREASGSVSWDTSPDGINWTSRASVADSSLFSLSLLNAKFYAETWGTGLPAPGTAQYANFNYLRYFVVTGVPTSTTAGVANTVTVEVRDAFGNRVTNYAGTVSFSSSDASATLPAAYTFVTADQGIKSFPGIVFRTAGNQTLVATDGSTMTSSSSVSVVAAAASRLSLSGLPSNATAGDSLQAMVTAFDAYGNVATNYNGTVHFTSSDPQAVLPADEIFLPADMGADAICCVSLRTAGAQTVTVADTLGGISTGSQTVTVAIGTTSALQISGVAATTTAGAVLSPVVTAVDAYGNASASYRGTIHFVSTDPQAIVPPNYTFVAADAGTRTFLNGAMLKTASVQSITATDTITGSITGRTQTTVAPAAAASFIVGTPATATAGTSFSASVDARDAFGNRATSYLGTVAFTSTDSQALLPGSYSFAGTDAGFKANFSVTFKTAGARTLTARDGSITGSSAAVQVGAAAAQSLFVSGFPNPSTAGASGAFSVQARDAFGNTATGYTGGIGFASSDARAALPPSYTFSAADAGYHSFAATLSTAGTQSISAADAALPSISGAQTSITVVPGSAVSFVVSGVPSPVIAGATSSITVEARDGSGNRATGYRGTAQFSSSDPSATLPAPTAFAAGDAGIKTISGVILRTSGTQSVTATDGSVTGSEQGIVVQPDVPTWPSGSALTATSASGTTAHLSWTAATAYAGISGYEVFKNGALIQTVSGTTLAADVSGLTAGVSVNFQIQAGNSAGTWTTNGPAAAVTPLPPDPQLIAPPIDMTVATTLATSTAFLYTGSNPIQTGVAAGTIDAKRVSVARGMVHDRSGAGISGVQVTVLSHPELGQTVTRADGAYDLALNGGSALTLSFHKSGLLDAQRTLNAVWQEFAQVDDLVMIPQDQLVTIVDMTNTTSTQVARGSVTTDDMGSRQATVLFPPGTTASLKMPNGSTQSASTLHIRATEFTIGSTGPAAMPAKLPSTSAYTYAVNFSADEATAAGATSVLFSQPVYGYVENFLAFPVGAVVPNGYYDVTAGNWVPLPNGRVIQIVGISGGLAQVDTVGTRGNAALSISNSELQQLASLYTAGQTVWRVPMQHFTSEDWNPSPAVCPNCKPPAPQPPPAPPPICSSEKTGSIIECETQVLGERIDVVGTPYSLNYRSSRQLGGRPSYRLDLVIPPAQIITMPNGPACFSASGRVPPCQNATGATVLETAVVYVDVAGRHFANVNSNTNVANWAFEWNGQDAYGRQLQGEQPVKVRTCLTSPAVLYGESSDANLAFAAIQNTGATMSWRAGATSSSQGFFDLCNEWNGKMGGWDDRARALGGWSLSEHHAYDPHSQTLYRGDGERSSGSDHNRLVENSVIGNGTLTPYPTEGAQARAVGISAGGVASQALAAGPDGSIYFESGASPSEIWKMTTAGTLTKIMPASAVGGTAPIAMAVGRDGLPYIVADFGGSNLGVRRRENDGSMTVLASLAYAGGYASKGIATGADGAIYFSDPRHNRVFKIGTDGGLTAVVGIDNTAGGFSGDGGLASQAQLNLPGALSVGRDGTLYITDSSNYRVRAVGPDGVIRTVVGSGLPCNLGYYCGWRPLQPLWSDGASQATAAAIQTPQSVAVARDGTLYVGDTSSAVYRVTPDGIIKTIASSDASPSPCTAQTKDCNPRQLSGFYPTGLALDPQGALLVSGINSTIARISSGFTPAMSVSEIYIASKDGGEVYVFDLTGRHLRTLDALTTATRLTFGYDGAARLISIADQNSNVTTVQRDAQGNPTAIVGPYGQSTALSLDGNGYLATITNPNHESVQLQYKPPVAGDNHTGGLLSQLTDPRLGIHLFQYNSDGFLTKDTPPDGAYQSLDRAGSLAPTHVTHTTALGRTTQYAVSWNDTTKTETASVTDPAGFSTTTTTNGEHANSTTYADGSLLTTSAAPDPRFGMDAYSSSATVKMPSGLTGTLAESRSATMHSATDPLTVDALVESLSLNGNTFTSSYNATAHTVTQTTPVGRQTVLTLDTSGRVTQVQPPGVAAISVHYDSANHFRPDSLTQGTRTWSLGYDAQGRVHTVTDPLTTTTLGYDNANRVTSATLPDTNVIGAGYDASGNSTSITPPGRSSHAFSYQSGDLEQNYTPPAVDSNGTGVVQTAWDLDRAVTSLTPTGMTAIVPHYNSMTAHLTSVDFSGRTNSFGYSTGTGGTGQLMSITTPDAVLGYTYDGSLLKSQTWSAGLVTGTVSRTIYDSNFWLKTETYGGQSINYSYDNDGLLTAAGGLTISRTPATGFVAGTSIGSITDTHTYDSYGAEQTYAASYNGTSLYSVDYGTRDALGRIVTKTETIQGVTHAYSYAYDSRGRLTDAFVDGAAAGTVSWASGSTFGSGALVSYANKVYSSLQNANTGHQPDVSPTWWAATHEYQYDANGNRLVGPGLTSSPVYDAQDRMTSYGSCTYAYKADGSLQTKTCGSAVTSYDYDAFGNLRHVTVPNGTNIDYLIDGKNRRIGKKVNGVMAEGFLYRSQLQPAAWLNPDGSTKARFIYGLHANVPEYMVQGGTTYRIITDQVGSVRFVENTSTGAVAERIDYDEFGNVLNDTAPGTQPFGFAGGLRDLDTGLTRFGARDHDPVTGRWTVKDPLSFGGGLTDLYSYVGSDPINKMDPKGLNVTNNSGCPIVVKGEEDSTGPQVIGPGKSWNYRDDGFYLPNGNVFKVPDWVDATINPDGSVTTYVSPAVPWNSTQYYKSVPGRWFWDLRGNVVGHWNDPNDPFLRKNTNWPQPGDVRRMFNSTGAGPNCGCSQ